MIVRNKRINGHGRAVFDVYSDHDRFMATVELDGSAPGLMRVLIGALQPAGKAIALEAMRHYECIA